MKDSTDRGMDRQKALMLLESHIGQDNLMKHCLATEAVMRHLARHLGFDEELWGLAGLLHDLDYHETKEDMHRHGLIAAETLASLGVIGEIVAAIKAHNADGLGIQRANPIDFAITAGETITGLIVAVTLVYPDKRIKSVKASSVVKRMKEPHFARNVSRENILLCEKLGLSLPDFVQIALTAMADIDKELGLA
jgi:putative nucleotidyltransferase with HDIG domain